jgi:uncharacterized protein YbaR (Trm112 family)/predicted SAM-dependent methyltransferase
VRSPLYEMLPKDVRGLVPGIYGSEGDLEPQELSRRVCDFIDECLAGDEPEAAAWLSDAQREMAAYLTANTTTVYDQMNAARDFSPAYLQAAGEAWSVGREGGVHLELGTWKSFPPERIRAIAEHDELAEFIRLDLDSSYSPEVVADCACLPFVERSIDRIASNSLLEHVAYPHAVIAESFRVLRAGGAMTITVPFHFVHHGCPQDYLRYTPAFFDKVCREAGFDRVVCETQAHGGLYYTLHQAVKAAVVREDLPLDEARSMRRLHVSLALMLAALTPLDSRFMGAGRQFFHSVSCIAFKPGAHAPRGRERNWERPFLDRALDLLGCPACKSTLQREESDLACAQCNRRYPIADGIPLFVEPAPAEPEDQVSGRADAKI